MDLIGLAFAFLMQNPEKAPPAALYANNPSQVYVSNRQKSFADLARGILQCYHPKAKFEVADVIERPWRRQKEFQVDNSAVIHIRYQGMTGASNKMFVVLMNRKGQVRSEVIGDTAADPLAKECELEDWKSKTS